MMLPRWGTLLTYGSADVISTLRSPFTGSFTPVCSGKGRRRRRGGGRAMGIGVSTSSISVREERWMEQQRPSRKVGCMRCTVAATTARK